MMMHVAQIADVFFACVSAFGFSEGMEPDPPGVSRLDLEWC